MKLKKENQTAEASKTGLDTIRQVNPHPRKSEVSTIPQNLGTYKIQHG